MSDQFVGLKYRVLTPNSLFPETLEQRFDDADVHELKSVAGKDFHYDSNVLSVCVFDHTGQVYLYLRKNRFSQACEVRESC